MEQQASPAEVAAEVKKGQALDLRIAGANYREIARTLKISVSTAHEYVTEGLLAMRDERVEQLAVLRKIEKARLEGVLVKLWPKRDNPRVADSIVRISERISKLEGLDVGKSGDEPPPPPPPGAGMPVAFHITLVAPDGTKFGAVGAPAPAGETKAPAGETKPADGGTNAGK